MSRLTKKLTSIIILLVVLCTWAFSCSAEMGSAEMGRTDDEIVFSVAIDDLTHINSKESIEEAQRLLSGITSNYNQANKFRIYAMILIDVFNDDFDNAQTKLYVLSMDEDFKKLISEYELQPLEVIDQYINARRLENDGRFQEAFDIYITMNFLDSVDRSIALTATSKEDSYQNAMNLFNEGNYNEAVLAFESLGQYKDSAKMAEIAKANIVEPELTPGPYSLNVAWQPIDWTNNEEEYYFVILLNSEVDANSVRDIVYLLKDMYSIPSIMYQIGAEETGQLIETLLNEDAKISGIIMYGFDWIMINDTIQGCTNRGIPVWVSEQIDYNSISEEIDSLFADVYVKNELSLN